MKYSLLLNLVFILQITGLCYGQVPTKNASNFNFSVDSTSEKLVLLALNNPRVRISEKAVEISGWDYSRTKTAWANNIAFSANLNEFTLKQTFGGGDPVGNMFFPRYNFSVNLPLGLFVNNPKATKAAKSRYEATLVSVDIEKQIIRKEMLSLYENYLLHKQLLSLQQALTIDARKHFQSQEQKFKDGKISFEAYLASTRSFNNEQVKELNLTKDLRVIEIQIEELIGMKLVDALQQMVVQGS